MLLAGYFSLCLLYFAGLSKMKSNHPSPQWLVSHHYDFQQAFFGVIWSAHVEPSSISLFGLFIVLEAAVPNSGALIFVRYNYHVCVAY